MYVCMWPAVLGRQDEAGKEEEEQGMPEDIQHLSIYQLSYRTYSGNI
jgi:hypothetical protein